MCESVFKVLVIGDSSVGKTAMVARYCHNRWLPHYKVTLGGNARSETSRSCQLARCTSCAGSVICPYDQRGNFLFVFLTLLFRLRLFVSADYAVKTLTWKDREAVRLHVRS